MKINEKTNLAEENSKSSVVQDIYICIISRSLRVVFVYCTPYRIRDTGYGIRDTDIIQLTEVKQSDVAFIGLRNRESQNFAEQSFRLYFTQQLQIIQRCYNTECYLLYRSTYYMKYIHIYEYSILNGNI